MSDTAVLDEPQVRTQPQPIAPPAHPKLILQRDHAVAQLHAQLEKGAQLKSLRIRNGQDLDDARAKKLEWITRTTELITGMFDTPAVAEQCNDWVGRIYPEYAEFGNFVEQFYAEMDHRLLRVKQVIKMVEQLSAQQRSAAPTAAPHSSATAVKSATPAASKPQCLAGLIVTRKVDESVREELAEFLESLDIEVSIVEEANDMADMLDRNKDVNFAIVLSGEALTDCTFELGFCAGRLGLKRVLLLHTQPGAVESRGFTAIEVDGGGGWQLQIARQLRRAGLGIDLNRLC